MNKEHAQGPIMRLFQVKVKEGAAEKLLSEFATTSADVVQNEPGNEGYCFGQGVSIDGDRLIFASFWQDLDAVKERFGEDWQKSYLPDGYDKMIEEHSLTHIDLRNRWFVRLNREG
ncbi:MAG: antibiotic biosynthesis monooxygenase [Pseudomonadota bacterium]